MGYNFKMTYNEVRYQAFFDELEKSADLFGTATKAISGAKNIANKALYNPKVISASNYFTQHNGNTKAMLATATGKLGGKAAATMGAPKLGKTIEGLGTGVSAVFKAS